MFSVFKFSEPVSNDQTSVRYNIETEINVYRGEHYNQIEQIKALTFGEALFDMIKGSAHLGGAPLNVAAHLAKLGAKPTVITAIGRDELGKVLLTKTEKMGIDISYILVDENRPTGTVTVKLEDEGIPIFTIDEGVAWDVITLDEEKFKALIGKEWDVFYFGTLAQRSEENRRTLKRLLSEINANNFFYDVNLRAGFYTKEWILSSLEHCTILKMNEEEAATISDFLFGTVHSCDTLCRLLTEEYPEISVICITKGPEGAAAYNKGVYEKIKIPSVEVADTVGAGDAFSAGFIYAYLSEYGVSKATSIACILGTYVASKSGSVPEYSEKLIKELELAL